MPSLRESLQKEARQFRELSRLFFGRFLDNDLISLDGDTRATLAGIFTLLAMPGLFLPFFELIQFSSFPLGFKPLYIRDLAALPDKVLHLALSMSVLGIVTMLEWDAILPDRRDYAVLRPLPIRLATMFSAKIAALLGFWALFTIVINAISSVFFPIAVVQSGTLGTLAWCIRCHSVAILAGNAFAFLAMIAVQGLLMILLGWRRYRRLAPYAQSVLVALSLVIFFSSIGVTYGISPTKPASTVMRVLPPIWFAGLYQTELGWAQPVFREMAMYAWTALGLVFLVAGAAYALSYRRSVARSFEDADAPVAVPGPISRALTGLANRWLLRSPAERASFHFVRHTLMRSRGHRVLVASYAGVGFALVFQSLAGVMASGSRTWRQSP